MKYILLCLLFIMTAQSGQAQTFKGQKVPKGNKTFFKSLLPISDGAYMTKTEITNAEYRQFVYWVRDSVAHAMLGHTRESSGPEMLDWEQELDWGEGGELDNMFVNSAPRQGWRPRTYRTELFVWEFANSRSGRVVTDLDEKDITVAVYPDTTLWKQDVTYQHLLNYFINPKYDDFPVVGITARQAMAYCEWKEMRLAQEGINVSVSLPTEKQWLSAAKSKTIVAEDKAENATLFGPVEDNNLLYNNGSVATQLDKAGNSDENEAGFFGLQGNVAEWVNKDTNPIAKGGHWQSGKLSTEDITDLEKKKGKIAIGFPAREYIGFRVVVK